MTDFEKITIKWNLYKMCTYTAGIIGACISCMVAANKIVNAFQDQQNKVVELQGKVKDLEDWRREVTAYYVPKPRTR